MKKLFSVLFVLTALCSSVWAAPSHKTILERLQAAPTVSQSAPEAVAYTVPAQQAAYANAPLKAVPAADNVQTFYGFMAHSAAWDTNTTGSYGIYSFPAIANTNFEKVLPTKNITAGAYADGRICGYYVFNYLGSIRISYYMYDADSGQLKVEKSYSPYNVSDIYAYYAYSLAYNYKDATLYGIFFRKTADDVVVVLSKVDQLTGVPTEIAELKTGVELINAIAFDDNGTLYAIGDTGKLYTVDTTTGVLTEVGSTGLAPKDPQCAYYDNETGKLYWPYLGTDLSTAFYSVDPATGAIAKVSDYPATTWLTGLYKEHKAQGKVPAPIEDFAVKYSADGALDAKISFTAPAKAADGSALSGALDVELYIDYVKVADAPATVNAGEVFTYNKEFAAGQHKVEVILKNEAGYGDRARTLTFAGSDVPAAPADLKFELEGRNAKVTWTAPTIGAGGGWFDASILTYKVVRQPDNKVVADAQTATTFTEEIPDCLGNYFYVVTAQTDKAGASAESNRILYGTSMTVPYSETFDTEAPLDLFTIEDANEDGYYWKWKDGKMSDPRGEAKEAADWLITPPIALTTEWIYKFSFDAKGYSSYYNEQFKAAFGDKAKSDAMNILETFTYASDKAATFETLIEVSDNGNYYLGIQHSTPAGASRDELFVDNIKLEPFISTAAPASVDNLKVDILADNVLKGTMTFKAPVKAINGDALTAITKVEIYRDNELVATKTDAEPGKEMTVEVDVPQGEHTFNVIAHNDLGRGHDSLLKSFGGIDVPLPVANIRYKWGESDDNKATLLWDAPSNKGIHGLDIPSMTYSILTPAFFGSGMMETVTGLTECSYAVTTTYTAQTLAQRGVLAKSDGGKSETAMVYLNMGPAAPLDAYESFGNGATAYKTWSISMLDGQANWAMYNDNPDIAAAQDGDNGFAMCIAGENGGTCRLISPAFDFSATTPAYLHLFVMHSTEAAADATLTVESTTNACDYTAVGQPIRINDGSNGWKEHQISLATLAGARKAMLGFRGELPDAASRVIIDNLSIDHTSSLSGVEDITDADGVTIAAGAGAIMINGAEGSSYSVYTPDGRLVAKGTAVADNVSINVVAGLYIVEVDGTVAKVTVK